MLRMVSYSHRPKSGQITCYLNRTYHVLTTPTLVPVDVAEDFVLMCNYTGKEVV
jgi:hypothetical protein